MSYPLSGSWRTKLGSCIRKILIFSCFLVLWRPAIAGFISNDKEFLRNSFQKQEWDKVIDRTESLMDSEISENQKDLYRLLQSMALFQQTEVDQSIEVLMPISDKSLYYSWAKLFLSRLAYVSDNRWLLENSLQELNKTHLKGDIKVESKFYEAHLLIGDEKWSAAEKILKSLEKQSRNSEIYPSILESQALVETHTSKSANYCKTLKKLYIKYPKHIWFEAAAPEIKDIILGKKHHTCVVSDKDFDSRRRNLNLMGEYSRANNEIQKWIHISKLSLKKQKILLAQQSVAEGHPEEALKKLREVSNYKSDLDILNPLSFAAARAGEMDLAIETALTIHHIAGYNKTGSMALYQAALWSYQMRDYENAEARFKMLKPNRLNRSYQKEVKWYLGWLRYLRGDYIAAEKSFRALMKSKRMRAPNENMQRMSYWLAMAQLQNGKRDKARIIFARLSELKGMNYYSFLARERLKLIPETPPQAEQKEVFTVTVPVANAIYYSPVAEFTPRPSSQELEEEELNANAEDNADDSVIATEDESKPESNDESIADSQDATPNKESEITSSEIFTQAESLLKIERAKAFWSVGLDELARREVGDLENNRTSFDLLKKITDEYRAMGLFNRLSSLGHDFVNKADFNSNKFIYEAIYPRAYAEYVDVASTETNVAKSLIWGIMKAESMYRPWVKSPVGALGLMQVMPTTGQRIADLLDYKNFSPQSLLQPQDAIRFGSKYLERLGKKFDHTVQLVAAAYNAGPHRVTQWLYYFGYMQMDEWVEHIPFLETRNYVKRVTVNYMAYNELYGKTHGEDLALVGPVPVQLAVAPETKENWE